MENLNHDNLLPLSISMPLKCSERASSSRLLLWKRRMLITSGATGGTLLYPWLFSSEGAEQNESQNLPPTDKLQELTWSAGVTVIHLILLRRTMLLTSGATGGTPPSPWLFSSAGAEQNESQNLPSADKLQALTWSAGASVNHLIHWRRKISITSGATGGTPPSPWLFSSEGAEQNESQNLPPADKLQALTWSAGASANHLFLWRRKMSITSGATGGTAHPYDMQLRRCCTPMGNTFHLFLSRLFV